MKLDGDTTDYYAIKNNRSLVKWCKFHIWPLTLQSGAWGLRPMFTIPSFAENKCDFPLHLQPIQRSLSPQPIGRSPPQSIWRSCSFSVWHQSGSSCPADSPYNTWSEKTDHSWQNFTVKWTVHLFRKHRPQLTNFTVKWSTCSENTTADRVHSKMNGSLVQKT